MRRANDGWLVVMSTTTPPAASPASTPVSLRSTCGKDQSDSTVTLAGAAAGRSVHGRRTCSTSDG
eukprot:scaffold4470_cov255-Prasinococcus_capsulatus_cf.AAC.32